MPPPHPPNTTKCSCWVARFRREVGGTAADGEQRRGPAKAFPPPLSSGVSHLAFDCVGLKPDWTQTPALPGPRGSQPPTSAPVRLSDRPQNADGLGVESTLTEGLFYRPRIRMWPFSGLLLRNLRGDNRSRPCSGRNVRRVLSRLRRRFQHVLIKTEHGDACRPDL